MSDLWPQPIEIIGLTGEYQSGKTTFGVTIAPGKRTRVYDFEKSTATYASLGFERIDVPRAMLAKFPNGYKPIDVFLWWLADIRSIQPGKFDVIFVDPVTDLERGLVDWVNANPGYFGHTPGQYAKMSGIMWGDVKDYWKLVLSDVAARCQTFAFTAHLGEEWVGNQTTGNRKPKGKDTLMELASLYLQMERKKDNAGNMPAKPSAIVLKSRLNFTKYNPETGDLEMRPALPPQIPVATPKAIRDYMLNPPDYENLKPEERAPERVMSDDERLRMQLAKAEAERDTVLYQMEREKPKGGATAPATTAATKTPATPEAEQSQPDKAREVADKITEFQNRLDTAMSLEDVTNIRGELNAAWEQGLFSNEDVQKLATRVKFTIDRIKTFTKNGQATTAAAAGSEVPAPAESKS